MDLFNVSRVTVCLGILSVSLASAILARAAERDPVGKTKQASPKTVEYEVGDLTGRRTPLGRFSGRRDAAPLIKLVVSTILNGQAGQVTEINGATLRINASAQQHDEIDDLLGQLRRMDEIKIVLKCCLIELDNGIIKVANDQPAVINEKQSREIRRRATVLAKNRLVVLNGREIDALSLHTAILSNGRNANRQAGMRLVMHGVQFSVKGTASADRRFVSLTVREKQVRQLKLNSTSRTRTIDRIPDGGAAIFSSLRKAPKGRRSLVMIEVLLEIASEKEEKKGILRRTAD